VTEVMGSSAAMGHRQNDRCKGYFTYLPSSAYKWSCYHL